MPVVVASFLGRFWPYIAGAAFVLAAFIGFKVVYAKLDAAQAQRDKAYVQLQVSNQSIGQLQGALNQQNDAIANLDADSDKRLSEGRALILAEVRKGTAAVQLATQLASKPKTGGDQAKTSDTVMAARSLL